MKNFGKSAYIIFHSQWKYFSPLLEFSIFFRRQNHIRHPGYDEIFHFSIAIGFPMLFNLRYIHLSLRNDIFFLPFNVLKKQGIEVKSTSWKSLIAIDIQADIEEEWNLNLFPWNDIKQGVR